MLLKICSSTRKRFVIVAKTLDGFSDKVKQMLSIEGSFQCVLEEDGSKIVNEVLEAIFDDNEKIGIIMILKEGEEWSAADNSLSSSSNASMSRVSADPLDPPPPSLQENGASRSKNLATASTRSDVRTLLLRNPKGQRVVDEYDKYHTLCSESRQTLVKITVAQLVEECGPYPTKEQKENIASSIVTSLLGLKAKAGITGYEHFFCESNGQTGYIQERLKRLRRSLAPEAHQRPHKKQPTRAVAEKLDYVTPNLPGGEVATTNDLTDAEVTGLQRDCLYANPVTERALILSGMAKTAAARQQWIRSNPKLTITEMLEKYPRLEDMAPDLLDIDFGLYFPDAVNAFVDEFPSWTRSVISMARMSHKADINELIREYDSLEHTAEVGLRDHLYALLSLLYLLPSADTRHNAKLSSAELPSSLIWFKPQQTGIDLFLTEKKASKKHSQPFLLCLGTRENTGAFFLILDLKAIPLGNCGVLKAIDALFKSHYVFYVGYSKFIDPFMEFLQKVLYKIECSKLSDRVREVQNSILAFRVANEPNLE